MARVLGPYRDRTKWRLRVVDNETGRSKAHVFETEKEARAAIPRLKREYRRAVGVPLDEALKKYEAYLTEKGNRPRSVSVTMARLRGVFRGVSKVTGEVDYRACWSAFASKPLAVDTRANVLKQTKTFLRWCEGKGWLKVPDPLAGVEVLGRRRKGKPQLTEDESKRFLAAALAAGEGGVAAATALLMGMRAGEIVDRVVRDLDAGGTKLNITHAKTEKGVRVLRVPRVLQPLLLRLAEGKQASDRLFGEANRHWLLRQVQALCKSAGVPVVPVHGLRGTHARLAVEAGISGDVVAASLGHESFAVTRAHYAGTDAVDGATIARVEAALN